MRKASPCARVIIARSRWLDVSESSAPPGPASRSTPLRRRCRGWPPPWSDSMGSEQGPRTPFQSPRFGQLATFMLLPAVASPASLDVALLGIPYDGGTSYRPGARFGPRAVREQSSLIRSWHPVLKVHPFERLRVADCGDVDVVPISIERTYEAITRKIDDVLSLGALPVCVGGDHSITLGILRSIARRHGPVGLVHFDAHPDT